MQEIILKNMPRVNDILNNEEYIKTVREIEALETDRIYCKHGFDHFLSVARIAMIINLDNELNIDAELIYSAAFLHDIGRVEEYKRGVRHEEVSAERAGDFLVSAGFNAAECSMIVSAIANHRDEERAGVKALDNLIYRADKLSRNCFFCNQTESCSKALCKRNLEIKL